jgi:hypothetical protein
MDLFVVKILFGIFIKKLVLKNITYPIPADKMDPLSNCTYDDQCKDGYKCFSHKNYTFSICK